jgi:D-2-hydroxyacid dehydrogenase (NADP+)
VMPLDVLVLLPPDDPTSGLFRNELERAGLGSDVNLRFCAPADAPLHIANAEVLACGIVKDEVLERAERLKWVAFWSAGLDGKLSPELLSRNLLLTNASGVHGPNIAEHVMAFMLMFTRRMEVHLRNQAASKWERQMPVERPPAAELSGQTLAIIGYGRIGECLAARANAFDMRVIAVKRDPMRHYGLNAESHIEEVFPVSNIGQALEQADHVCIAVPYTRDTHHMFNRERLAQMKPGAYLYNIARGAVVDEKALIEALAEGRLGGAGLDVFETEPLPVDSPLWQMPNVFITPHVSGLTPHYFKRFAGIFAANLQRYLQGTPLSNLYVPDRGY